MAKRTYGQYCGLAAALDVVGERWALLVVRELDPGPRRFTDLLDGLPGIATDVLASRLRSLEAAGAVEVRAVRHPAPAKLYALTERGERLAAIAGDLALWGMPLLAGVSVRTHRTEPRWALGSMARRFRGGLPDGAYAWTIGDTEMHVEVRGERARLRYGPPADEPLVHVEATERAFFRLVRGAGLDGPGLDGPGLTVTGPAEVLGAFLAAMPLELTSTRAR